MVERYEYVRDVVYPKLLELEEVKSFIATQIEYLNGINVLGFHATHSRYYSGDDPIRTSISFNIGNKANPEECHKALRYVWKESFDKIVQLQFVKPLNDTQIRQVLDSADPSIFGRDIEAVKKLCLYGKNGQRYLPAFKTFLVTLANEQASWSERVTNQIKTILEDADGTIQNDREKYTIKLIRDFINGYKQLGEEPVRRGILVMFQKKAEELADL